MDKLNDKIKSQINDLESALRRLEEALNEEKDDFVRDSVIQRFEFCFELCWKIVKNYNSASGKETFTPKESFRVGAQTGIIDDPKIWFEYLKDRNLASHTYDQTQAERVYQRAKEFLPDAQKVLELVQAKVEI